MFYCLSVTERELLEMLPLSEQCSADEAELVRFCYESRLNKVGQVCKHRTGLSSQLET